jgi:hypothetical protein
MVTVEVRETSSPPEIVAGLDETEKPGPIFVIEMNIV